MNIPDGYQSVVIFCNPYHTKRTWIFFSKPSNIRLNFVRFKIMSIQKQRYSDKINNIMLTVV